MEVICISDNLETAIGLRFSGINTVVINNREEINNYLETIIKENKIGIVVVTKKIYELCKEKIEQIRNNSKLPLIVNIP